MGGVAWRGEGLDVAFQATRGTRGEDDVSRSGGGGGRSNSIGEEWAE